MASSNPRYQALLNEEDENPETEQITDGNDDVESARPLTEAELPPPYDPGEGDTPVVTNDDYTESPPLYSDVVKLPTYNEAQNIESEEDENSPQNRSILLYLMPNDTQEDLSDETIGTDLGFIICFLITFIFNGIGFIIAYCSTNTLSSHYGAISGFGLSLVKWAFIVKHSQYSKQYFEGSEWVLYVIILLGWMIFLRGMFAYVQLKRFVYSRWGGLRRQVVE